ncbi:unnamed protein product [Urochloa humidicola]
MAEPLASPPPPPGAPSPTSLTSGSTPDPAATHHAAPANLSSPAPVTFPHSFPHPNVRSSLPVGRSKEQRWCDNSPASSSSGDSAAATSVRRSYWDVAATSSIPSAPSKPLSPAAAKPPPRIVLRSTAHIPPPPRRVRDADSWEQVESRSNRRARVELSRRPRRPVPADLRGRCFNCFSGNHRAAQCKSQTRCFKCRALGHRSLVCPRRSAVLPKRATVWRRIEPTMEQNQKGSLQALETAVPPAEHGVASDVPRAVESGAPPPDSDRCGRRRRRPRHRRCRGPLAGAAQVLDLSDTAAGNGRDASPAPPAPDDGVPLAHGPPCIIDWSTQLARAEADLRRAVLVTIVSNIAGIATDDLKTVVANAFVLNSESLEFRRSSCDHNYIMFVEDEATITRLTNAGPTPGPGDLQLHCRRWTRHAFAEGDALPVLANVELRGIPEHAWEMSTAESLLSPYGWPHILQPATRNREDYSAFRLSAWCFNPREVPSVRALHIVEPPIGEIVAPPGKPSLKYTVAIRITEITSPGATNPVEAVSGTDEDEDAGSRRRQRRRATSPSSHGGAAAIAGSGRSSVRDRLGPDVSGARHVACSVEADRSSSQAMRLDPPPVENAATGVTTPEPEEPAPVLEDDNSEHEVFSVATSDANLGREEGDLGLPVGRAESQPLEFNLSDRVFQEKVTDSLPSMESPTLVCFAVTNSDSEVQAAEQQANDPVDVQNTTAVPQQPLPLSVIPADAAETLMEPHVLSAASPVTWRPAEEVLPADFSVEPEAVTTSCTREISKVYARRPKAIIQQALQPLESPPRTPPPPTASSTFIEKVVKPLDTALPIPTVKQPRRRQNCVGTEPPRRSRRIANLPPENHNPAATSVCRELGFTEEDSKVSAAMVEKYQAFFNTPLKRNDVRVMAAMLHKELPEELPAKAASVAIVVV